MTDAEDAPGYQGYITKNTVTLAEVLKSAGYNTGMTGKWHVSNTNGQKSPEEQLQWLNHQKDFGNFSPLDQYPTSRGFDKYFGNIWGVVDFFDPFSLVNGTKPVKNVPADYYHTDAINDTAVAYIRNFAKYTKPFFLYIAQTAPHWPLMAKPKDIAKYEETYKAGWDAIRRERYRRMSKSGIIDTAQTPLPKRWKDDLAWADNPDKDWDARAMAVHAAMIDCMDQGIGRIIDALRATKELDNTLIIFLSDNGASPENCTAYGPGFDRPNQTRDGRPIAYDMKKQILPGNELSYASIGPRWANVANTPFQFWKAESYEGGVHTPMIAFWPKGIRTKGGEINRARVGHVMDLMPTFVELSGAKYPTTFRGNKVFPTTGLSMVPSFRGSKSTGHSMLFNEHFGARYARSGDWKVVAKGDDRHWQLFNLAQDRTETKDLAADFPEVVKQLDSLWNKWANTHQVFPKPKKAR
ncbi:arylsulfatase [Pedobacter westerhofensis]|uniref:Arylsulfatase n=1 Tax=Pedobacter westerhofensis TaxID=425512 RepID=A0A521BP39_9SPHI|nr:arylsulfatase [Pedobacter westerhofensis]